MSQRRFWCPNEIFDRGVPAPEILMYQLLCRQAGGKDGRSRQSVALLVRRSGLSRSTVLRALRGLEQRDMVEIRATRGRSQVSVYRVRPVAEWKVGKGVTGTPFSAGSREGSRAEKVSNRPGKGVTEAPKKVSQGHPEGLTTVRDLQLEGQYSPAAGAAATVSQPRLKASPSSRGNGQGNRRGRPETYGPWPPEMDREWTAWAEVHAVMLAGSNPTWPTEKVRERTIRDWRKAKRESDAREAKRQKRDRPTQGFRARTRREPR